MTNRMKLLAAVATIALPAGMAGAQGTQHAPLGQGAVAPSHRTHRAPATTPTPAPAANTATEDAQTNAPAAEAPATVNQNAEPGTQTAADAQATTQAQTPPPAEQAAPAAEATTEAQAATATPAATATAPAAQAQAATPAPGATAPAAQAQAAATPPAAAEPVRAATAADLHAGIQVRDQAGGVVGTVETADASGAVVSTGTIRARLPLTSFGTNGQNLVISMTKGQLEAAATHAQPQPSAG